MFLSQKSIVCYFYVVITNYLIICTYYILKYSSLYITLRDMWVMVLFYFYLVETLSEKFHYCFLGS